jgi:hypothetical protein
VPIRIVQRDNQSCPVVFCDHCRKEITTGDGGNYEWNGDSDPAEVFFTHNECSQAFDAAHPEITSFMKLTVLPLYLSNNLKIDPKQAQRSAELGAQM